MEQGFRDRAERVAASLEPLAALEAEVVLAVDDRMPAAFDPGYRRVADRVIRVPFPGAFSHLYGWLAAQCSANTGSSRTAPSSQKPYPSSPWSSAAS